MSRGWNDIGARLDRVVGRAGKLSDEDFERLYAEHAGPMLSFLVLRCGDRGLAEDLLADTFERVLRKRRTFDSRRGSEKGWLYSIALNLLRDHARKRKAEPVATEDLRMAPGEGVAAGALEAVERRDLLGPVIGELSPEERETVALRFGADLSVPEIAELTGKPFTTVQGRVYRALRKMRIELLRVEAQSRFPEFGRIRGR